MKKRPQLVPSIIDMGPDLCSFDYMKAKLKIRQSKCTGTKNHDILCKKFILEREKAIELLNNFSPDNGDADEEINTFISVLRYVVDHTVGIANVSKKAQLGRENMYKILAPGRSCKFHMIVKILNGLDIKIKFK